MNRTPIEIEQQVAQLAERLTNTALTLAVAESCTGGLLGATLTDRPGSSKWFERGWITYSNQAKHEELGVEPSSLASHGAVSAVVATEMAMGALRRSPADLAVAISGIAGPGGGSADKPVGTVCLGWARRGREARSREYRFSGDRIAVREQSVAVALEGLLGLLD